MLWKKIWNDLETINEVIIHFWHLVILNFARENSSVFNLKSKSPIMLVALCKYRHLCVANRATDPICMILIDLNWLSDLCQRRQFAFPFKSPHKRKWLFDVALVCRKRSTAIANQMIQIPIWIRIIGILNLNVRSLIISKSIRRIERKGSTIFLRN